MPVPRRVFFVLEGAQALIDAHLAEDLGEGGVYVCGSAAYLEWVAGRSEAGKAGGKKSAEARKAKTGSAVPPKAKNSPKQTRSTTEANAKQPQPSVSASASSSVSASEENTGITLRVGGETAPQGSAGQGQAPVRPKRDPFTLGTRAKMRGFLGAYAEGYKAKYGGPPEGIRDKAIIGKVGHWIESVSEERAISLIQVYLQIDYRPITESQHDLWQFFRNLNRIGNALSTGEDPSGINWNQVFASTRGGS